MNVPFGPCFNTRVDIKKLEEAILVFLDKEEANDKKEASKRS